MITNGMLDNLDEAVIKAQTEQKKQVAAGNQAEAFLQIPANRIAELSRLARVGIWTEAEVIQSLNAIIKLAAGDPSDRAAMIAKDSGG